jgi:molybdate/tungstate transport system substrate-binding protein
MHHGLKYLELPPEINLGAINEAQTYQKVTVNTDYQRFATVNPVFGGTPIIYGMTIPNNAQNPSMPSNLSNSCWEPKDRKSSKIAANRKWYLQYAIILVHYRMR